MIIVDWLVESHKLVKFSLNTLFLTTLLLDRLLITFEEHKFPYNLLAIGSLMVASKSEDTKACSLNMDTLMKMGSSELSPRVMIGFEDFILKSNVYRIGLVTL